MTSDSSDLGLSLSLLPAGEFLVVTTGTIYFASF
jgi:hypothetical protein